jgi:RNA polymerase-binding transcription factor DksA
MNVDPRSGLTEQQVELSRMRLLQARNDILARGAKRRPTSTPGASDAEPAGDAADQAEGTFEQGLRGTLSTTDRERLHDIDDALTRIDHGHYGVDEVTGEAIGFPRLSAAPWARFTQDHQEQLEGADRRGRPPSL